MPVKIYGVICPKGGVGKTTVCANMGAILADMDQRVLLVDADPQQSLSRVYELEYKSAFGLTQLYQSASPVECISKTRIGNLDIVLNDDPKGDSGAIVNFLRESFTHSQHLHIAMQELKNQYDYILIDTQGAKGIIQETVIFAADVLLSPVKPQVLDSREFIRCTVDLINKFKTKHGIMSITGRSLPPLKVLINMWDRTSNADEISRHLRSTFDQQADGLIVVLSVFIPAFQVYAESIGLGVPVHRRETSRRGPSASALITMLELVYELEPKLIGIDPHWPNMHQKTKLHGTDRNENS